MPGDVRKEINKTNFFECIKAIIISLIICLLLVLLSAFILNLFDASDTVLRIVNTVIKILSILVGCLISFKSKNDGWLKGIVTGIVFVGLAYLIFSILDNSFTFNLSNVIDLICGAAAGLVSGIISVNIRK